ncbi:MAG: hypothetical protein HOC74_40100 [Gemmatimonadetes bacterium]|jgi:hypothetical protein|nr:hypothetical protein [Gemmatimonadota bacterium]
MHTAPCLGNRIDRRDPVAVIRAVFTHFLARYYLVAHQQFPQHLHPQSGRASVVIELLHQDGWETVRDLTRRYFASPKLHERARALLTREALDQSAAKLSSSCAGLPRQIGPHLAALLFLVDPNSGHLSWEPLRRNHPQQYNMCHQSYLLDVEKDQLVLEGVRREILPVLEEEYHLHIGFPWGGFWLGQPHLPEEENSIKTVRWQHLAGQTNMYGFANMTRVWQATGSTPEKSRISCMGSPDTIYLLNERIWLHADVEAFRPVEQRSQDDPAMTRLIALKKDLGGTDEDKANTFRQWLDTLVYWHEIGHVRSDKKMVQIRERIGEDGHRRFQDPGCELLANLHVLQRLEEEPDEGIQRFWIALASRGWMRPSVLKRMSFYGNHDGDIFVLRALMEAVPSAYLAAFLERLEKVAGMEGEGKLYRRWLRKEVARAREEWWSRCP